MDVHNPVVSLPTANRRHFVAGAATALAHFATLARPRALLATSHGTAHGNRARLLSDDSTSLLHRLQMIDAAQHELFMSAYEVGDDQVALRVLAGLRAAARRGVQVKLMIDGHSINNLIPKPMMEHLIAESVAIKEHQPDVRYKLELGRQRMHDKLLIVDGEQLIIGGRNVRADYYGMSCTKKEKNRWDRDAYVTGPIVQDARCYFLSRWSAETSGQPTLDRDEKKRTEEAQHLGYLNDMPRAQAVACAASLLDEALQAPLPYSDSCCHHHGPTCDCETFHDLDCVRFLHDIPEHAKDCPTAIATQLNLALERARQHVILCTPYLVISSRLREILQQLRDQHVEVILLTNSLTTTDRTITHAQYANERRWMLRAGIDVWEMHGQRMLHAKSMVIDGCRSMIGSYNFDVLSETRNSETALLIDHIGFAEALTKQIVGHLMQAVPLEEPLLGYDARQNPTADARRLNRLRAQRLISPWIKRYL